MIQLDILCIGFLERDEDGGLKEAHSTSTLIRADGRNIVVDTSTEYMWPAVKTSFRQIGIFPEDVDTVILTHTHSDHRGNLKRYPKAKVLVHKGGKSEIPGARIIDADEYEVCPGVRMVHTPGHCTEETSVFIDADHPPGGQSEGGEAPGAEHRPQTGDGEHGPHPRVCGRDHPRARRPVHGQASVAA